MIKIKKNVVLAPYTNYKIGGRARYFCEISMQISTDIQTDFHRYKDVVDVLKWAEEKKLPVFVLGGGTNILISDDGFAGLIIKIKNQNAKVKMINQNAKYGYIGVGAGMKLSDAVNFSFKNGLSGLEWAAGIPGTAGGAVRGNAGAFEDDIASITESIVAIVWKDRDKHLNKFSSLNNADINAEQTPSVDQRLPVGKTGRYRREFRVVALSNKQCKFGYRTSIIKEKGGIILSAMLRLRKIANRESLIANRKKAQGYIQYRKEHHPLEYPSCGSVFKNIDIENIRDMGKIGGIKGIRGAKGEIFPAGLLIEKAGLKGKKIGNAQISEKHCNFIVNLGNAKANDIYELIKMCEKEIYKKFGIKLEREVKLVGFDFSF